MPVLPKRTRPDTDKEAAIGGSLFAPGLRIPRHRATTAHVSALYPFHADSGLGPRGIYVGEDVSAGGASWHFDPFQLYTDGVITSPNILVLGMVGAGKSSAVKTMLYRMVGLLGSDGKSRWCAILDPKGEYGPLADALGLTRLALFPGGQTRLNPLDAGPYVDSTSELRARRTQMTAALAASMLRRELSATEEAALAWVIDIVTDAETDDQVPTLRDVVDLLATPTDEMLARSAEETTRDLARSIAEVRHGLGKLLDGPLRGMFDGPSTVSLDWSGRGVVIDLSAVHQDPDALTVVMIAATGWLQALLAAPESEHVPRRIQVLEEIWALLGSERVAKYYQSCQKLARAYGSPTSPLLTESQTCGPRPTMAPQPRKSRWAYSLTPRPGSCFANPATRYLKRRACSASPTSKPNYSRSSLSGERCGGWAITQPSSSTASAQRNGTSATLMEG